MTGCGKPLRRSIDSDIELHQSGLLAGQPVTAAVLLDDGPCGQPGPPDCPPRFCSHRCYAKWRAAGREASGHDREKGQ